MRRVEISVTEAARSFSDCINRAHYQETTFVLLRNGEPVAQISPVESRQGRGRDLAEALSHVQLSEAEARAWREDLDAARKMLLPPDDKWV